jgi:hypothetical protein
MLAFKGAAGSAALGDAGSETHGGTAAPRLSELRAGEHPPAAAAGITRAPGLEPARKPRRVAAPARTAFLAEGPSKQLPAARVRSAPAPAPAAPR